MKQPIQQILRHETAIYLAYGSVIKRYDLRTKELKNIFEPTERSAQDKQKYGTSTAISDMVATGQFLVFIRDDKKVIVIELENYAVKSERDLIKRGCTLAVADETIVSTSTALNGSDRKEHLPILGHVSMLTTLVLGKQPNSVTKSIITADRDEHIRISCFPNSYVIQGYCLGHTEFVSALLIPSYDRSELISAGGDDFLIRWDWTKSERKRKVSLELLANMAKEAGSEIAITKLLEVVGNKDVVMLCQGLSAFFVYRVASDTVECVRTLAPPLDCTLSDHGQIWMSLDTSLADDTSNIQAFALQGGLYSEVPNAANEVNENPLVVDAIEQPNRKAEVLRRKRKREENVDETVDADVEVQ